MTGKGNIVQFPETDLIEHEAALWVMRLSTNDLSADEEAELESWLRSSAVHRDSMERMAAVWGAADMLSAYNSIAPIGEPAVRLRRLARLTPLFGALAATLLVVSAVGVLLTGSWFEASQKGMFETVVGERRTELLADRSTITLNTDTRVLVDIDRELRTIRLVRGEAHFDVAEDADRPFRVHAGRGVVEAVGTAFSVRLQDDDVEVTVAEGSVEVFALDHERLADGAPTGAVVAPSFRSVAALSAQERAILDQESVKRAEMDEASLKRELLWRDGLLAFSGESLAEVVREMSRYTNVRIEIADPSLATIPIGGSFEAGNVEGMLESLEKVFGIEGERTTSTHVRLIRKL